MSTQHTAMASYTLLIDADSGYTSTTEGRCTAAQYGAAIAALHSRPNTYTELKAQRDELLEACKVALGIIGFGAAHDQISAAIAKATGETNA